jgi:hypothetical protein
MKKYCWSIILFAALILVSSAVAAEDSSLNAETPATTTVEIERSVTEPNDIDLPTATTAANEIGEEKEEETDEQVPEIETKTSFVDPWLNSDLTKLAEFLQQNWTFNNQLKQNRDLKLAIIKATKTDRYFRRNAELLSREPGFSALYSSLCLFSELLEIQIELNQKLYSETTQSLLKRELNTAQAIALLQKNQTQNSYLIRLLSELGDSTNSFLNEKIEQSRQNRHISSLLAKLRKQNIQTLELFKRNIAECKKLFSQTNSIYDSVATQLQFLESGPRAMTIKAAARLARAGKMLISCKSMLQTYRKQLVDLAIEFYRLNEEHFAALDKLAQNAAEQQTAIKNAISHFPERDMHPAQTRKFSYLESFMQACAILSNQALLYENKPEDLVQKVTAFSRLVSLLHNSPEDFSSFRELFDTLYNPETIEASEAND